MVVANIILLFFVSSCTIIHLGKKPVSGGSPPKDSKEIRIVMVIVGVLFHRFDRASVVVLVLMFSIVNMATVSIR